MVHVPDSLKAGHETQPEGWTPNDDTIVAVSSAPGAALRGIVRLSGPQAFAAAAALAEFAAPGRFPTLVPATLRAPRIAVQLLLFREPRSFTGQDLAEFHIPGAPALLRMLLDAARAVPGVRPAGPGEFSARAFFAGKIDLTEAEGIAATINAANARQLRAAAGLRSGRLHGLIAQEAAAVAEVLARVEAGIDFADEEDVRFITPDELQAAIGGVQGHLQQAQRSAVCWERLDATPTVVLVGAPNVGKSSLLNVLTQTQRAIVSPIAGTTRDVLGAVLATPHGPVRVLDVAGIEGSADEIAAKMNAARERAMFEADAALLVIDERTTPVAADALRTALRAGAGVPTLVVRNKCDLPWPHAGALAEQAWVAEEYLEVSALTGAHLPQLRQRVAELAHAPESAGGQHLSLNARHRAALCEINEHLAAALTGDLVHHPEVVAAELRQALDALGRITGTISPEEILGRIFGQFCIGK